VDVKLCALLEADRHECCPCRDRTARRRRAKAVGPIGERPFSRFFVSA
jgi:hypothetical protein